MIATGAAEPQLKLDPVTFARLHTGQRIRFDEGGQTLVIHALSVRQYGVNPLDGSPRRLWPVRTVRMVEGAFEDAPQVMVLRELTWEQVVYLEDTWGTR